MPGRGALNGKLSGDSNIPEFFDRFSDPCKLRGDLIGNPILYMRANVGAPGITGTDNSVQYNLSMLTPYGVSTSKPGGSDFTNWNDYFKSPSVATIPRGQNEFVLISAGPDGIYGTKDDITNFGNP